MVDESRNEVLVALEPGVEEVLADFVRWALPQQSTIIESRDMETARKMLRERLPRLCLAVMGFILPRDPAAAEELKEVMARREVAYDPWLRAVDRGLPPDDPDLQWARYAVEVLDRKYFELCDRLGGLTLIEAIASEFGVAGLPPVLFLVSFPEDTDVSERALSAVARGEYLSIPVSAEEVANAIRRLLKDGS